MREYPAFVPELDIVAVLNGKIAGNAASLKNLLLCDDGKEYEVLGLGPISVLPEYQRKGIGGKLIEHTKKLAQKMGFRAIFLYGDPAYYGRQGFLPAEQFNIRTADQMYAAALQALPLYPNALDGLKGRYIEDQIYEVDSAAATVFDKAFPPKKKTTGTPSQKRFQEILALRKNAGPEELTPHK